MTPTDLHLLYDYNSWAWARVFGSVSVLTPEQFLRDLKSSHGGVQGTLAHAMGAEEIWLCRWLGRTMTFSGYAGRFPTFEALTGHWKDVESELNAFVRSKTTDEEIRAICSFADLKGNKYSQPYADLMQHLVNHSSYHRGQIATLLRQLDAKPIGTDLVTYQRELQARTS